MLPRSVLPTSSLLLASVLLVVPGAQANNAEGPSSPGFSDEPWFVLAEGLTAGPVDADATVVTILDASTLQFGLPELVSAAPIAVSSPAQTIFGLLDALDLVPTGEETSQVNALDGLDEPLRTSLAQVVAAFVTYADAARTALDSSSVPDLDALVDFATARAAFVAAALTLAQTAPASEDTVSSITIAPALTLDLSGLDSVHTTDVALLIDLGGNDRYLNNAGGTGSIASTTNCSLLSSYAYKAAAAAVDVSGNDLYDSGRSCGINGGGAIGSGLLLDVSGNDVYAAGAYGTNGGAFYGAGLLADLDGTDSYVGTDHGVNGGGVQGTGLLYDASGNDAYAGTLRGVNGGASLGAGLLLDRAGADTYTATDEGVNGGGIGGQGVLLDLLGDDGYRAGNFGTNGGANGGVVATAGFLYDRSGNDRFEAGSGATNGGGNLLQSSGFLFDGAGHDVYVAGGNGANGGGFALGVGRLVDAGGNDRYTALGGGANGGGTVLGVGLLLDAGGTDEYADSESPSGSGIDRTLVKGLGAQVDVAVTPGVLFGASVPLGTVEVGPDADGDHLPSTVQLGQEQCTIGGQGPIDCTQAPGVVLEIDPNDADAANPVPSTNVSPVPTGAATVGPDADGDHLPAYVEQPMQSCRVGASGAACQSMQSVRLALDPNDQDVNNPIARQTLPPAPTSAPLVGPDADGDHLPAYVEQPMSSCSIGLGAPGVTCQPAPPVRLVLDPNDLDAGNPVAPQTLPLIPVWIPQIGPDADEDGVPGSMSFSALACEVNAGVVAHCEYGSSMHLALDPDDTNPHSPAHAAAQVGCNGTTLCYNVTIWTPLGPKTISGSPSIDWALDWADQTVFGNLEYALFHGYRPIRIEEGGVVLDPSFNLGNPGENGFDSSLWGDLDLGAWGASLDPEDGLALHTPRVRYASPVGTFNVPATCLCFDHFAFDAVPDEIFVPGAVEVP